MLNFCSNADDDSNDDDSNDDDGNNDDGNSNYEGNFGDERTRLK